jgi:long-chain acyl-CoA synthetase
MSSWGVTYLAIITYGAVVVPILPEFSSSDIHHIVNHSESKMLFCTDLQFDRVDDTQMPNLEAIISITGYRVLVSRKSSVHASFAKYLPMLNGNGSKFNIGNLSFDSFQSEDLAVLSYTSGTSGFSKGVMLPHRSIWSNVIYAHDTFDIKPGDRIVSFLPLAHAYGCLFEFLWPFTEGCHITFLTRTPSPQIITEAFRDVKPNLILAVPLILEKIFKKNIQPKIESAKIKALLMVPGINKLVYRKINKSLVDVFGGEFSEMIIGGAALNKDVELFLRKIGFPFTIGYGMTECGPLISYAPWQQSRTFSAGSVVNRMRVKIDSPDPYNVVGEILVKGDNTMLGYYKNKEATDAIFDAEGWLHTGDLGVTDSENFIYIKGRSKNMILGPSGQNIYPEEIEATINSLEYVHESLVRESDGKLEALIYPDYELADKQGLDNVALEKKIQEIKTKANAILPSYMNVAKVTLYPTEFEKTPKKSIKRYIYV